MFRKMNNQAIAGMTICLLIFVVMLAVGAIFVYFILTNLVEIGIGLLFITIPFFLMIVGAILAKRYLFGGDKK